MAANTSTPIELLNQYLYLGNNTATHTGPTLIFDKAFGPFEVAGSATTAADFLGTISFVGDDATASVPCAAIDAKVVDATVPGSGVVTSQLIFSTFLTSLLPRMVIAKTGAVTINTPEAAGTGLTISGGGIDVTGAATYTATTFTVDANAASPAIAIALEASAADGIVEIKAGTGGILIGNEADTTTIDVGNFAPTANRTITVGGGTVITAATTDTIDIGPDGATTNANSVKTVNVNTGGVTLGQVLTNIATGTVTSGTHTTAIATGNCAAGTMALNIMTGTGTKTANVGNADGLTTVNIDAITLINDSINVQTSINTGTSTGAVAIGNALAGAMTMDTAAGISLDAATVSNFTVTGAGQDLNLQSVGGSVLVSSTENAADAIYLHANGGVLETIHLGVDQGTDPASVNIVSTAGGITMLAGLATADAINIMATDAAGGIDIDAGTNGITADATGAISLDAGAVASNFTVTGAADLTVNTTLGSLVLEAGEAAIDAVTISALDAAGGIDVNAGTGGITVDTTGTLSLDSAGATNLTATGAFDVTVSSTAGSVIADGGEAAVDAVQITASNVAGGVDINAGTGGITVDTTGTLSLDSAGATNLTATGAFDVTVSSTAGSVILDGGEAVADAIQITSSNAAGGLDLNAGSGGVAIDSVGGAISIDAQAASNFSTTTGDLTLASTAGSVVATSGEAVADAIQLTASNAAGGITMSAAAAGSVAVLDANGLRYPSMYRLNAVRTGGGHVVGAGNVVIFNTEGFDPGADYDNATGVYTVPATGIYRISVHVNCTDVVGGGLKTVTLRDNGAGTNYFATATVGNTLVGDIAFTVLYAATAGHTLDIYFAGGAGDTANNGSTLNIEFAYSV